MNQPEYRFIYELSRRYETAGVFFDNQHNIAPYDFSRLKLSHPLSGHYEGIDGRHISLFGFLSEDFRTAENQRAEAYESIRGGITARPHERLYLYANFFFDEKKHDDPGYTGKKWRGVAGEVENAFMAYTAGRLDIFLGRYSSFWGPAEQSLIFSSTARPMDAFSFRLRWKKIHFTYQFAKLSRINSPDTGDVFENRYFAGHRLDFRPWKNLQIGLFETVLFGGPGRNVDLTYLNPIMFYHAVQLNEDVDDNTFVGLDVAWYLNRRHKFYGQLMIDDMQVDDEAIGDQEPDEIGYMVGVQSLDVFDLFDIRAEYLKITNRTYNQKQDRNRYDNRGMLIGHEFGCDGDRIGLTMTRRFDNYAKLALDLSYQRRGEGRYDDPWSEPWREYDGDYSEPFPTGVVEKRYKSAVTASGFYHDLIFVRFEGGLEHFENFDNTAGDDRTVPYLDIRLSFIFNHLVKID